MRAIVVKNRPEARDVDSQRQKSHATVFPHWPRLSLICLSRRVILDGEIVALDEKGQAHFSLIQPRIHLSRAKDIAAADQQIPVYFYAFDLLYLNGYNLMKFPLVERKAVLRKLIPTMQRAGFALPITLKRRASVLQRVVEEHGLEGIVAKLKTSEYQQARSRYWLKIKTQHTDHFVVGGFTPPEGSRKYFGALLLGLYKNGDLIYVGRSGGGFDDPTLAETIKELKPLDDEDVSIQGSSRRSEKIHMGPAAAGLRSAVHRMDIG